MSCRVAELVNAAKFPGFWMGLYFDRAANQLTVITANSTAQIFFKLLAWIIIFVLIAESGPILLVQIGTNLKNGACGHLHAIPTHRVIIRFDLRTPVTLRLPFLI